MTGFQALVVTIYTYWLFAVGNTACPMNCYCANREVECSANMEGEFPVFPPDTEKIKLSQLNVRYIPVNAFKDLPDLQTVHITNSNIAEFQSCSIADLSNLTKIIVDKSAIGNIESYAFKNLRNIDEIRLENCRIGRIKPFAFYDIANITVWNMISVHMQNLYAESFFDVSNIDHLVFHKNNFSDVVTGAFSKLTKIRTMEAYENKFWNLQCGNLDDLMNAATEKFNFAQNTFYCNCSINWLLNDAVKAQYGPLFLSDNSCHGPESIMDKFGVHNLSTIAFSDLNCKGLTESSEVQCKGVEKLIPNPVCPKPGEPSVDVIAIQEMEKKNEDGKNDAVAVKTSSLCIAGVLGIILLR